MITPLAVVIPALDAAASIIAVVDSTRHAVPHANIIVVDDGSTDATAALARKAGAMVVRLEQNRGKGAALRAGISVALQEGSGAIITLDADGQHDPEHVPALLVALDSADIAIGTRARSGTMMPIRRRLTNALASSAVTRLTGAVIEDSQSGFRAFRRRVAQEVQGVGDRFEYETDFLIRACRAGLRIVSVPIPTIYGGRSHFRSFADSASIVRTLWRHRAEVRS
ncbi:MAG: glycosyltransferase family 2 protein [Gemmatimonadaceae bacterium]